jgi:hypothetical protein
MASKAISAQGSKLEISSGAGASKNITAIALGKITKITSNAHGFANGDQITFAAIVGTTELNGQTAMVDYADANSFYVKIDSSAYTAYTSGGTVTSATWTQVKELKSFSGFDGSASEIDVTDLDSTAKEFRQGLQDFGQFKVDIKVVNSDPGQAACKAAKASGVAKTFRLTLPNAEVATFSAFVKSMPVQGGVDAVFSGSIDLKISGDVTWA